MRSTDAGGQCSAARMRWIASFNVPRRVVSWAGRQVGRMRIELPGRYEDNVVPIGFLREQGLQIDVLGREDVALAREGAVK